MGIKPRCTLGSFGILTYPNGEPCDKTNVFFWCADDQMTVSSNDGCQKCLEDDWVDGRCRRPCKVSDVIDNRVEKAGSPDEVWG